MSFKRDIQDPVIMAAVVFVFLVAMSMAANGQEVAPDKPEQIVPVNPGVVIKDSLIQEKPGLDKRPLVVPRLNVPERAYAPARPARPNSGGGINAPGPLRNLVQDFQTARESYMAQQRDLLRQIKEASAEERDAIRQQLKEKLEAWLQEQKDHIQTIRDQAKDMKNNVPALREVIDAAKEEGRTR